MNTNAWLTLRESLALAWWDYYQWFKTDPDLRSAEPPLSDWDQKAVRRLVDIEHSFRAFKKAHIAGDDWRLLSVWGVTHNQIAAGFKEHGDAEEGGDLGIAGFWAWSARGDAYSAMDPRYNWRPAQVVKFMPDECSDPPECANMVPADAIWDVVLLAGQPPRELPAEARVYRR